MTEPNLPDLSLERQHLEPPDGSIPIHLIKVPKDRGRQDFKNIIPLRDSIIDNGLINPITVSEQADGTYKLIAGETRLRACAKIPWTAVPCYIKKGLTPLQEKEIELEENLRRQNLSWQEECTLMEQIDTIKRQVHGHAMQGKKAEGDEKKGWGIKDTAKMTGKSEATARSQIGFAKKLKERPDIAERVAKLPYVHAQKEFERILEAERLERLHTSGQLQVTIDFKQGDARELIQELPDESVDLVVWDPPFGIEALEEEGNDTRSSKMKAADNMNPKEAIELMDNLFGQMCRVLKPGAHFYLFFSFNQYPDIRMLLNGHELEYYDHPLIWDKQASTTIARGYNYMSSYEPILYGWKPPRSKRLAAPMKDILQFKSVSKKVKLHAFEKPLDLLETLIKQSSNLGDTILDLTAGSGATLAAALRTGRSPVGFELDREHYLRASARLAEEKTFVEGQVNA